MLKKWKRLSSQLAFDHRWYKVRQDRVQLPDGNVIDDYFVSLRPDVAMVLPITANQEIVLVRQYRHGAGEILLELPAGTFDPAQEQAAVAAQRELQEETGYLADALEPLATLYDNPVKETNRIHLFLAQNVQP
ncbi:MAG: NUDIX hydrolase, partial [Cyanobacteria bacterium P01_A01_bin.105]